MSAPKRKSSHKREKQGKALWKSPLGIGGAIAAVIVLVGVGFLLTGNSTSQPGPTPETSSVQHGTSTGTTVGQVAAAFFVKDIDDRSVSRDGTKPTVLFFMAAWCASCAAEEQALVQLHQKYKGQINIVSIDVDERSDTSADLRQFQRRFGGPWPHALSAKLALDLRVKYLDTTLILDKDGVIVFRDERATEYNTLEREIKKIL